MSFDSTRDFLRRLECLPNLPQDRRGEWWCSVQSGWIDGVSSREGELQDPNMHILMTRSANNEEEFEEDQIHYEIRVGFTRGELSMNPQAAIDLGHHLIAAGTTAMRDLARNAWFLSGTDLPGGAQ